MSKTKKLSLELVKFVYVSNSNLRPRDYEQLHLLNNCQCDEANVTSNTKRHNFPSNSLEYNKL